MQREPTIRDRLDAAVAGRVAVRVSDEPVVRARTRNRPATTRSRGASPRELGSTRSRADADESSAASTGVAGWFAHRLPHFRVRHIGLGTPLEGTSWLNRPMYAGGFLGESFGGTLVAGEVDLKPSLSAACGWATT